MKNASSKRPGESSGRLQRQSMIGAQLRAVVFFLGVLASARIVAKEPVKTKSTPSTAPVQSLTFTANAGIQHAADIREMTTVFRLDLVSGRASMALDRHNGDLIGRPIGLFGGTLGKEELQTLTSAIEHTAWSTLPEPEGSDITASSLALAYVHDGVTSRRQFNARNLNFLQAITPIMNPLRASMARLLAQPQRALLVEAHARLQGNDAVMSLILRNVGSGPLLLSDPRHGNASAWVRVALLEPTPPGTMEIPPTWIRVPLSETSGERTALQLSAGQSVRIDAPPWPVPKAGGNYLVQAVFDDYAGPPVDAFKVLPFGPFPAEVDARPYVIVGAAFSSYHRFHAPPR
ncbi:MAG: hypothetical protein ABI321_16390 [Polyangia bacterium]